LPSPPPEADYIIVGGGSAGSVLANRLSADPRRRVLVLEAGERDMSPFIHVPAGIARAIGNPRLDWMHMAKPDPSRGGKVDLWPAGRTLGGSSSINGMLYVRGVPSDYDRWAALGCEGWSFADVEPYFRRLERTPCGEDHLRGRDGPIRVNALRTLHPLSHHFIKAATQVGLPFNPDYNGPTAEGIGYPQVTQSFGRRWSAARGYLGPARRRSNLRVQTGVVVERLVFEDDRCIGVEFWRGGTKLIARARSEVLVCAGALGSPKLLMLSGIGPAAELNRLGIEVRHDAPVGENLLEHPNATLSVDVNVPTFNLELNSPRIALHALNWLLFGRGPATSPYPHAVGFFKSSPDLPSPDIQIMFGPFAFDFTEAGLQPYLRPSVTAAVSLSYPHNAGRIILGGPDPATPPMIEHALLRSPGDVAALTRGCRFVQRIFRAPAFAPFVTAERLPLADVTSDADWDAYLRRTTFLGYHPIGTCWMGRDGVTDPRLRVKGVRGLRVVDASVIPSHLSGNIYASVIMIAERASDLIIADSR
jgi:choline dehydrogenase